MTNEQAILHLNGVKATTDSGQMQTAIDMAIKALEKQIPQPVQWTSDRSWGKEIKEPVCPVCDYYVTRHEFFGDGRCITYCDHCGQAIDWEAEDEAR